MNIVKRMKLEKNDGFYFPLFNLMGLRASITPFFGGDLKMDQHHYALEPTTEKDLYHNIASRNVCFVVHGDLYFLNGQTERQQSDQLIYETGLLYQRVIRNNPLFSMDTISYIPLDDTVERHRITLTNLSDQPLEISITTAVPIYGRSADNLRDHRQVTSLLNQIETVDHGILVHPTLSFDERGHQINQTCYSVFAGGKRLKVKGYIPVMDDFVHGGSLHFPKGLDQIIGPNHQVDGYEAMGAIQFETVTLAPKDKVDLFMSIGIHESIDKALETYQNSLDPSRFTSDLKKTEQFFETYLSGLVCHFHDDATSKQLTWVNLQPMLRRYFGNSYLPHHDYGRGGRGWRDLWQDLLVLITMNDASVIDLLYNNFNGIRIDGSNATIIGDKPGEFKADRNMITRVWSDHGAWPLITTKLYIDETGDLDFLLRKQGYFMDQFTHYTKHTWVKKITTNQQTDAAGKPYQGTILEHLLLQNLVGHHNIGPHGYVRLEDADWNDGLDMAHHLGETIAFTHMYANNLRILGNLIEALDVKELQFFKSLKLLLIDQANLSLFFDEVVSFDGQTFSITKVALVKALKQLADQRISHLNKDAFEHGRYESYYDNTGKPLDTEKTMALTGQAMALLSETATPEQAKEIAKTTKDMLYDSTVGGYKLNSDYKKVLTDMGRAFGFAYGHKENGAVFSHMAVMYAYGLYQYDLVHYGHEAFMTLLKSAQDSQAKVWLGIPEYFNNRGIGMYPYLTGSASWMMLLIRNKVFGIEMSLGRLYLKPKLCKEDFINGKALITTYVLGKKTTITYYNTKHLDFGQYEITSIAMAGVYVNQGLTEITGPIEVFLDEIL